APGAAVGGGAFVAGVMGVLHQLGDVARDIAQALCRIAIWIAAHGLGDVAALARGPGPRPAHGGQANRGASTSRRFVTPGIQRRLPAAARCILPLGFARQTPARPGAELGSLIRTDAIDRVRLTVASKPVVFARAGAAIVRRRTSIRLCAYAARHAGPVLSYRDLGARELERAQADAVNWGVRSEHLDRNPFGRIFVAAPH